MDGFEIYASQTRRRPSARDEGPGAPRSFLFLQGPISGFFDRLGRALVGRGHRVQRVNLHFGDRLFWNLPAIDYRGRFPEWREFVGDLLDRHQVTDLVLHGDRRPYHMVAAEEARARGIAVIATDLGYVRPDWLTLEYDGMTTYSRFPRDPAAIRALAAEFPEPELAQRFHNPFWLIAPFDVIYNLGLVLGRPLYPHYRYHSVCHPFLEYAGWIGSRPKKFLTARATAAAKRRLQEQPKTYFLVPLQLQTDFQIRAHSPFDDVCRGVRTILASFAASGCDRTLVFIVHPLDNGLINWHRLIARLAGEHGIGDRVTTLHGGTPPELVRNTAGIVTINSTVGLAALYFGVPVKVLGNAIFDVPGLTCQESLDAFWHDQPPPDPELLAAYLRALIGATQVKGGFYERSSQECAVAGFVERLEWRPYPLAPLAATEWPARVPRAGSRSVAVAGVSGATGAALARACAVPGVQLYLIGRDSDTLEHVAEDCRLRGALVETLCTARRTLASLTAGIAQVDLLVVHGAAADGAGRDLLEAMDAVATLAEPMRRRGQGSIVLVSGNTGRAAIGAMRSERAWQGYAAALRRRLRAAGVTVTVVQPAMFAMTMAARLDAPAVVAVSADRVAEMTLKGLRWRRPSIAVPGTASALVRASRLLPSLIRRRMHDALLPRTDDTADEAPLVRETAAGE
jgi:capsular polysaccharide export protein